MLGARQLSNGYASLAGFSIDLGFMDEPGLISALLAVFPEWLLDAIILFRFHQLPAANARFMGFTV